MYMGDSLAQHQTIPSLIQTGEHIVNDQMIAHFIFGNLTIVCIEMDQKGQHILTKSHLALLKTGCLIIDAAADADGAIEGTHYTSIGDPMYYKNGVYYYCVNNVPSLIYRTTSEDISAAFAKAFYNQNIASFLQLIRK